MELWRPEDIDLVGEGHFSFDGQRGEFSFLCVRGEMDCRYSAERKPTVEFSWCGDDEGHPVSGRGSARLEGEVLTGRIFFHDGDDSSFRCKAT